MLKKLRQYFEKNDLLKKYFNKYPLSPFGEMVSRDNGNVALPGQYRQGAPN